MLVTTQLVLLSLSSLFGLVVARPQSYAVWAANSAIKRGQGNGLDSTGGASVSYEHGELQWGLRLLYEKTGNRTYYDYILAGANRIVSDAGVIQGGYRFIIPCPYTRILLTRFKHRLTDYSLDPVRSGQKI